MSIKAGLIGFGYWGPKLARNLNQLKQFSLEYICDSSEEALSRAQRHYPSKQLTSDVNELLASDLDAILIATPVSSHFQLGQQALSANKHVFIEKPLTLNSHDAQKLIELSRKTQKILMVDHTFIYTGAVQKIKELIQSKELGDILYYDSTRVNLGLFQHDTNVLWDLAVHDLAILDYLLPFKPRAIACHGISHFPNQPENMAHLTLHFDSNCLAHINVNWLSPVKIRQTLIGGTKKMLVYNDLSSDEKIKVYDKHIDFTEAKDAIYQMLVDYRTGDMFAPKIALHEALNFELLHFAKAIQTNTNPITDGQCGLSVVQMLEAAQQSMNASGQLIELDSMI